MATFAIQTPLPPGERVLFHYTSQVGLEGILRAKSIWATNIRYLNDAAEFRHTAELLRTHTDRAKIDEHGKLLLDTLHHDVFDMWRSKFTPLSIYVASFSTHADQLSQWRAYAPSGGCCIGFRASVLKRLALAQGYELAECVYGADQKAQKIEALANRVLETFNDLRRELPEDLLRSLRDSYDRINQPFKDIREQFVAEVTAFAPFAKDMAFKEEAEWRLVSERERIGIGALKFRPARLALTPYAEFNLSENAGPVDVYAIVVGPSLDMELSFQSAQLLCATHGIQCQITTSDIPYREVR